MGARASRLYNEQALLLSLQAMLVHGTKPCPFFAKLTLQHLGAVRARVLARCLAYLDKYLPAGGTGAPSAPSPAPAIVREGTADESSSSSAAAAADEFGLCLPPSLGFLKALQAMVQKLNPPSNSPASS